MAFYKSYEAEMFQFFMIPKALMEGNYKKLSFGAKFLYGLLLDRNSLSVKNNWIDEDDNIYIYYSVETAMEELQVGKNKAIALFKELNDIGLIVKIKQGLNKPNRIYVKKFAANPDINRRFKNQTSGSLKNKLLEVENLNPNNTEINYTEMNKTTTTNLTKTNNTTEGLERDSYDDKDIEYIKERFEKITHNEISYKGVIKLLDSKDIDTISKYLDNYEKFKVSKHNPIGFLIKAIMEGWTIPKEEVNSYNSKPIQSTNFEQRVYDDEYFDNLYENFRIEKKL